MNIQIDETVRIATPEEEAEVLAIRAEEQAREDERLAIIAAKESAKIKLAALGLTDEEIKALVGG